MVVVPKAFYDAFPVRKRTKIGLDMDGVIAGWPDYVLSVINKRLGTAYKITDWRDYYGVRSFVPEAQPIIKEMVHDPVSYLLSRPLKGAVRAVRTLSEFAEIHIITCRPAHCFDATDAWLRANAITNDFLTVTQGSKADVVRDLGLLAYVDDRADYARELVPHVEHSILFDQSWNQEEVEGTVRIRGWMSVLEYLLRRVM